MESINVYLCHHNRDSAAAILGIPIKGLNLQKTYVDRERHVAKPRTSDDVF